MDFCNFLGTAAASLALTGSPAPTAPTVQAVADGPAEIASSFAAFASPRTAAYETALAPDPSLSSSMMTTSMGATNAESGDRGIVARTWRFEPAQGQGSMRDAALGPLRYDLPAGALGVAASASNPSHLTQGAHYWNGLLGTESLPELIYELHGDTLALADSPLANRPDAITSMVVAGAPSKAVPEPGSLALFALGLSGILLGFRRRAASGPQPC